MNSYPKQRSFFAYNREEGAGAMHRLPRFSFCLQVEIAVLIAHGEDECLQLNGKIVVAGC